MITHPPTKTQVSDLKILRSKLVLLEQSIQVLENCRAADSLTLQSFQKRNVQLMRDLATRNARIIELEAEVRALEGKPTSSASLSSHLNPLEIECQGAECCGGKFPPANLLGKDSSQACCWGKLPPANSRLNSRRRRSE